CASSRSFLVGASASSVAHGLPMSALFPALALTPRSRRPASGNVGTGTFTAPGAGGSAMAGTVAGGADTTVAGADGTVGGAASPAFRASAAGFASVAAALDALVFGGLQFGSRGLALWLTVAGGVVDGGCA